MSAQPLSDTATLERALAQRGVNPELAAWIVLWMASDAIERTVRWYDAQHGRVGPGVLVEELKAGGRPAPRAQRERSEQQRYAREILAWLERHVPDVGRHPAAIAAVIRLHHQHATRTLGAEHADAIRAAVASFNTQWGTGQTPKEGEP